MKNVPQRFKWPTNGIALKDSIITGKNYRFTVLTSRLIRIEYDKDGIFENMPSQSIFYRNFPKVDFSVSENENDLKIETEHLIINYKKNTEFTNSTLSIKLKDLPKTTWNFGESFSQLGGTARTLDLSNGAVPLENGVCSRTGFSVVDDSNNMLINEDGWIDNRREDTSDYYFFGYGHDYINCIKDYYRLTGAPPLLPQYALGNWWSRYHKYTQEEYSSLIERFEKEDIPFSVAVVDMDWHVVKIPADQRSTPAEFANGWTGYSWNEELFPDYKAFLSFLKDHGYKTTLNLHPAQGVRQHEKMYSEMAKAMGIDPASKNRIPFDVLNPDFMDKYFDILHHPYEKDGVDFWWMDWQQGTDYWWIHDEEHNENPLEKMDPLWMLNHLHILDIKRDGKRPMFFSRFSGIGSHRYPVGFSGDTFVTWESLKFQPYFTATASNLGYSWWSHDIGGHMGGYRDDELVVRWMQLGVFSPINRLHSTANAFSGKEPWNLNKTAEEIAKKYLQLRHQMFPYLYTMNYRNHKELLPLVQPMYYSHPECDEAYNVPNEFWFGSEMIVNPITEKTDIISMNAKVETWLPDGIWTDLFTGVVYNGGRMIDIYRTLEKAPVFCKAGAIVPMDTYAHDNKLINRDELEILVFPGADNNFSMYEDEGDYSRYSDGHFATTKMELSWGNEVKFTINPAVGDLSLIPKKRTWHIKFRGFMNDLILAAKVGNNSIPVLCEYDKETNTTNVTVAADITERVEITINGKNGIINDNHDINDRIFDILLHAQVEYSLKLKVWEAINEEYNNYERLICDTTFAMGEKSCQSLLGAVVELLSIRENQ